MLFFTINHRLCLWGRLWRWMNQPQASPIRSMTAQDPGWTYDDGLNRYERSFTRTWTLPSTPSFPNVCSVFFTPPPPPPHHTHTRIHSYYIVVPLLPFLFSLSSLSSSLSPPFPLLSPPFPLLSPPRILLTSLRVSHVARVCTWESWDTCDPSTSRGTWWPSTSDQWRISTKSLTTYLKSSTPT